MTIETYPLLGFAPDLPQDLKGVITTSSAILPTNRGIGNGVSITSLSAPLGSAAPSMGAAKLSPLIGNNADRYLGTQQKLYWFNFATGVAVDVTPPAGVHATAIDPWSFAKFGDAALAVNKQDNLLASTNSGTVFATVAGAPKASIVITPGLPTSKFAMVFDYNDGVNDYIDGVYWSALGNHLSWTTSVATQCGNIRITDIGGRWSAATPFRDGVVAFKQNAMYLGTYVGPGPIWEWQRISSNIGCVGKNALCVADDVLYFASNTGLWVYDGGYPRPMVGAVHQWWASQVDSHRQAIGAINNNNLNSVRLTWDEANHQLWCGVGGAPSFAPNSYIVFNTRSGLWTYYGVLTDGVNTIQDLIASDCAISYSSSPAFYKIDRATVPAGSFTLAPHGATYGMTTFRSARPQFAVGPSDVAAGWLSGTLYYGPTLRNVANQSKAMSFAVPGRLDAVQQDRFLSPRFDFAAGTPWECVKMAVDTLYNPNGE